MLSGGDHAADQDDGGGGMLLYLALFILLLAFFILLTSLASYDERRAGQVLESVDRAFSLRTSLSGRQGDRDREAALAEASRALRDLGDLFQAEIPLAKVEAPADGSTLVVTLGADDLFTPGTLAFRPERAGLVHRIADVLAPRPSGVQVRTDALVAPGDAVRRPAPAEVARAGALARGLVDQGAPAAALSIGIEPGRPAGELRFLFRIHDPAAPAVRLSAGAGAAP
ncbi:flagellar motor protein MotB [Rhodocista pekingensis]|uniref:Flagellar motor protein MotB n=1 Tax=Rhodocista pekingensis TaxID=201185 RepID=A0ABW2KR14_9PROT